MLYNYLIAAIFLLLCIVFIGFWPVLIVAVLFFWALVEYETYKILREKDPKYIAKKKERLKKEAEESERERQAFYQRCLDNLKKYSD